MQQILSASRMLHAAAGNLVVWAVIGETSGGAKGIVKACTGTLTLNDTNIYTGVTTISGGTLELGAGGRFANSASNVVGSAGFLGTSLNLADKSSFASGTVNIGSGKTVTINGTHAVGNAGTHGGVGTQNVTGNLSYASGSIFSWDLASGGTSYDKVVVSGSASGPGAVFQVVNAEGFSTPFWDLSRSWSDIFTTGTGSLASIFASITGSGITWSGGKGVVSGQGSFAFSGNTLNWTPSMVPEPSGALAGVLIGLGLLRRRR